MPDGFSRVFFAKERMLLKKESRDWVGILMRLLLSSSDSAAASVRGMLEVVQELDPQHRPRRAINHDFWVLGDSQKSG